jgi:hypothetical protein
VRRAAAFALFVASRPVRGVGVEESNVAKMSAVPRYSVKEVKREDPLVGRGEHFSPKDNCKVILMTARYQPHPWEGRQP